MVSLCFSLSFSSPRTSIFISKFLSDFIWWHFVKTDIREVVYVFQFSFALVHSFLPATMQHCFLVVKNMVFQLYFYLISNLTLCSEHALCLLLADLVRGDWTWHVPMSSARFPFLRFKWPALTGSNFCYTPTVSTR